MSRKNILVAAFAVMAGTSYGQTIQTVQVSAVVGGATGSFVRIAQTAVDFGTVVPGPGNARFASNVLTCEFFAATSPWEIDVYTMNEGNVEGLVSDVGEMPIRFNQPDLGEGDPNNDEFWNNPTNAVWRPIVDDNNPGGILNLSDSTLGGVSPIDFKFAIDTTGVAKTNYSANIYLELVFP